MKLNINNIKYNGDDGTYVIFEALKDLDIGKYILLDYTHHKIVHTFWFPDMQVKQGDLIYLHIVGKATSDGKVVPDGHTHILIWELPMTAINVTGECLVLVEASDWTFKEIQPLAA